MNLRTALIDAVHDVNRAQHILFDDHIRLDRVAAPADLPRAPLTWRRTLTGWELDGTVLPGTMRPTGGRSASDRPC